MKLICVMVSSLNGEMFLGNTLTDHSWTSKEDREYFTSLLDKATCIIMGRHTYEAAKAQMVHKKGRCRIVLTSNLEKYQKETIPGQLEFTSDSPLSLCKRLTSHRTILLVGGAITAAAFFKDNLIDELLLTIEPILFGNGSPIIAPGDFEIKMRLVSTKRLNKTGTLLLKYTMC